MGAKNSSRALVNLRLNWWEIKKFKFGLRNGKRQNSYSVAETYLIKFSAIFRRVINTSSLLVNQSSAQVPNVHKITGTY